MKNLEQTIVSQYANSPVLLSLIESMNEWVDPGADIDQFYSMVWDVGTAVGFGLNIWGKIVGVGRLLKVPLAPQYFGFDEGETQAEDYAPFDQAPFYNGPTTGSFNLSDVAYRTLILVKALANISNATAPNFNQLLQRLFAGGRRIYALDQGDMQMQVTCEFFLEPYELAILKQSGALPVPAGVGVNLLQVDVSGAFGFEEAGIYQPFDYGTFANDIITIS